MTKTRIILFISICFLACQGPYELESGYWVLQRVDGESYAPRYLVEIRDDTMIIQDSPIRHEFISMMNLTKDSINLPNPCVLDRAGYVLKDGILFIDSHYILKPIDEITSELIFEQTDLKINLREIPDYIESESPELIDFNLFIGKSDFEDDAFFEDNYQLKINDIFADSSLVKQFLRACNNNNTSTFILLYADQGFDSKTKDDFITYLHNNVQNNLRIYEGYFSLNEPYFLEYDKLKRPSISKFSYTITRSDTTKIPCTTGALGSNDYQIWDSTFIQADLIFWELPSYYDSLVFKKYVEAVLKKENIDLAYMFRDKEASMLFKMSNMQAHQMLQESNAYLGKLYKNCD